MATPEEEQAVITEQTEEATAGEDAITEAEAIAEPEPPAQLQAEEVGGSSPEDIIGWFNSTIKEYDATFIIYYRGVW